MKVRGKKNVTVAIYGIWQGRMELGMHIKGEIYDMTGKTRHNNTDTNEKQNNDEIDRKQGDDDNYVSKGKSE